MQKTTSAKPFDVQGNKDGLPVNWNGRDWILCKCTMTRYLACYEVKDGEWRMDDICGQRVHRRRRGTKIDAARSTTGKTHIKLIILHSRAASDAILLRLRDMGITFEEV
ncbi:Hypothetical protein PHPALM_124 [Phytophthora palmivora]|uniref:Uncharacterized protein n=1 Tax=Phytophthora palmivora TaxID=4796 RepID=A0A2P4YVM5_9STRA|nr:Hypothetical protein PHPALM_124 [Phytophthora palmivora]